MNYLQNNNYQDNMKIKLKDNDVIRFIKNDSLFKKIITIGINDIWKFTKGDIFQINSDWFGDSYWIVTPLKMKHVPKSYLESSNLLAINKKYLNNYAQKKYIEFV